MDTLTLIRPTLQCQGMNEGFARIVPKPPTPAPAGMLVPSARHTRRVLPDVRRLRDREVPRRVPRLLPHPQGADPRAAMHGTRMRGAHDGRCASAPRVPDELSPTPARLAPWTSTGVWSIGSSRGRSGRAPRRSPSRPASRCARSRSAGGARTGACARIAARSLSTGISAIGAGELCRSMRARANGPFALREQREPGLAWLRREWGPDPTVGHGRPPRAGAGGRAASTIDTMVVS